MTENEAIDLHIAENLHRIEVIEEFLRTNPDADDKECKKNIQILTKVNSALQEIQQYRAIGTVDELEQISRDLERQIEHSERLAEILKSTKDLLKKRENLLKQYCEIGTVDECREAREKQKAKKPILCMNEQIGMFVDYADGHGEYKTQMNNWWRCPFCNEVVGQRVIVHKHIHDQRKKNFCEKCGQAISWERDTD